MMGNRHLTSYQISPSDGGEAPDGDDGIEVTTDEGATRAKGVLRAKRAPAQRRDDFLCWIVRTSQLDQDDVKQAAEAISEAIQDLEDEKVEVPAAAGGLFEVLLNLEAGSRCGCSAPDQLTPGSSHESR